MRCPHCAGEIPAGSRFCGICGRSIAAVAGGAGPQGWAGQGEGRAESHDDSVSLFELPAARGARRAKMALILVLDAILAGAGIIMLVSYLESRRDQRPARPSARTDGARDGSRGQVEVLTPARVAPPRPQPARDSGGSAPSGADRQAPKPVGGEPDAKDRPRQPPSAKPKARPKPRTGTRSDSGRVPGAASGTLPALAPQWDADDAEPGQEDADEQSDAPSRGEVDGESSAQIARVTDRLRDVVDGHQADLEQCYLAANSDARDEPLEGRIEIRFVLMPDGSTAGVTPTANTTGSEALADCVIDLFRSWAFPGGHSEPLELEWPFLFRAPVEATDKTTKH
jgi:hypothetical protein